MYVHCEGGCWVSRSTQLSENYVILEVVWKQVLNDVSKYEILSTKRTITLTTWLTWHNLVDNSTPDTLKQRLKESWHLAGLYTVCICMFTRKWSFALLHNVMLLVTPYINSYIRQTRSAVNKYHWLNVLELKYIGVGQFN